MPVQRLVPDLVDESDLHGALAGRIRGVAGGGDRDFFHRIEQRAQAREVAVGRLQVVVLHAHAVERDVDGAARQAADGGAARRAGGIEAGKRRERVERVAARKRQAGICWPVRFVEIAGEDVCTTVADSPTTVMFSDSAPTCIITFTEAGTRRADRDRAERGRPEPRQLHDHRVVAARHRRTRKPPSLPVTRSNSAPCRCS